ncbi:putative DNA-binding transcriptional regulator AlpA [Bradyrhizobium elkanii]
MPNTPSRQVPEAQPTPDQLVPDPVVAREFGGVSLMTLYRWTNDPKLGFPPPVKIRTKNFRSRRAIEDFKARMMRSAVSRRSEIR